MQWHGVVCLARMTLTFEKQQALRKMILIEVWSLIIPAVLPVAPSYFARAVCKNERGLLHGIEDVSNAHEYSRRMISDDATALLRDRKHMSSCAFKGRPWRCGDIHACKKSLNETIHTGNYFMQNQVEVSERQELQDALKVR